MSEIKFKCPNCEGHISADESFVDALVQCPHCAEKITMIPLLQRKGEEISKKNSENQQPCSLCAASEEAGFDSCSCCGRSLRPAAKSARMKAPHMTRESKDSVFWLVSLGIVGLLVTVCIKHSVPWWLWIPGILIVIAIMQIFLEDVCYTPEQRAEAKKERNKKAENGNPTVQSGSERTEAKTERREKSEKGDLSVQSGSHLTEVVKRVPFAKLLPELKQLLAETSMSISADSVFQSVLDQNWLFRKGGPAAHLNVDKLAVMGMITNNLTLSCAKCNTVYQPRSVQGGFADGTFSANGKEFTLSTVTYCPFCKDASVDIRVKKSEKLVFPDSYRPQGLGQSKQAGPARHKLSTHVTECKNYECPQCGAVLQKPSLGITIFPGQDLRLILGFATCPACKGQFSISDVYGGKYDIAGIPPHTSRDSKACSNCRRSIWPSSHFDMSSQASQEAAFLGGLGVKCSSCGTLYCSSCLSTAAQHPATGGRACPTCGGAIAMWHD